MPRFRADNVATNASAGPFVAALLIAGLIHLILIQGMGLALPGASSDMQVMRPLEITMLQRTGPSDEKPISPMLSPRSTAWWTMGGPRRPTTLPASS